MILHPFPAIREPRLPSITLANAWGSFDKNTYIHTLFISRSFSSSVILSWIDDLKFSISSTINITALNIFFTFTLHLIFWGNSCVCRAKRIGCIVSNGMATYNLLYLTFHHCIPIRCTIDGTNTYQNQLEDHDCYSVWCSSTSELGRGSYSYTLF